MPWPFPPPSLPTSELYGLAGHHPRLRGSRLRMGEAFQLGGQAVLVRLAAPPSGGQPFHILIDDDIEAALADPGLPEDYRKRLLGAWNHSALRNTPDQAQSIIVPSARLESIYQDKGLPVVRIDPAWPVPAAPPEVDFHAGALQTAFLGTRSHLPDLELLREALTDPARNWAFHHYLGTRAPDWLSPLPGVVAHQPLPWPAYRRTVGRLRFHLCLYPMRDTPVNAARSCNKLMEHAMTGASSLYSACIPFADRIRETNASSLVTDDAWAGSIRSLANDRDACRQLAAKDHQTAHHLAQGARASQRHLWKSISRGEPFT